MARGTRPSISRAHAAFSTGRHRRRVAPLTAVLALGLLGLAPAHAQDAAAGTEPPTAQPPATKAQVTSSWELDGDAGDSIGDRDGVALPGVSWTTGGATFLRRDDSEIRLPHDPALEPGQRRWQLELDDVVPAALTRSHQAIATSRSTTNQGWAFYIMPNGELRFWSRVIGQGSWAQFPTGVMAEPGKSYDVSVVWEPGTLLVEISGDATSSTTFDIATPVVNDGSNPVRLGNGGDRGTEFFYNGSLGGVSITASPRANDWSRCQLNASGPLPVTPPDPSILGRAIPQDEVTQLALDAARNSSRYINTTYWDQRFADERGDRIDLASRTGNTEYALRGPAMAAVSTAIMVATGAYDPADTGVSEAEARARAVTLVSSAAAEHRANERGGWGTERSLWQASLWAYYNGFAAWLLWDDLNPGQRACVTNMVAMEADEMPEPAYYRDRTGTIIRPGNTQAEENAWRSSLSGLAASMMPRAAHSDRWRDDALDLALAAWATPEDVNTSETVNGRRLDQLLDGSNVWSDGTVENHNLMHPIYMLAFDQNVNNALAQQMTGQLPAAAFLRNVDLTYGALVDLEFPSPPWLAPGGTIYVPDSESIYYPDGNDWGTTFPLYFAQADVIADSFGIGTSLSAPPASWATRHLAAATALQDRFDDGHTYLNTIESNYRLREERTAQIAAHTFLARFLNADSPSCLTNRPYTSSTTDPLLGELEIAWLALGSEAASALPAELRADLTEALDAVTHARKHRSAEVVAKALSDLRSVVDSSDVESTVLDQVRDAVSSVSTCVLGEPAG